MRTSLCKQVLLLTICLLLFAGQQVMAQNTNQVVAKLSLTRAESYWVGYEDQSELIRKERAEHPESGDGHGGWYIKVEFPWHPSPPQEFIVEFSFYIEKDPFHPKHPTDGNQSIVVNWNYLKPLSFQVTKNGSVNYAVGPEADKLEKTTRLIRRRMNWKPFEIFLPWELFHLYQLFDTPEKQAMDGFRVGVYVKADVFYNGRRIGGAQNVPIIYHVNEVESSNMKIEDLGTDDITSLFDEEPPHGPGYNPTQEDTIPPIPREPQDSIIGYPPPPPPTPHVHSYVTSYSFGTPREVKVQKPVKFAFPDLIPMSHGNSSFNFAKINSDLGDNVYIGRFFLDVKTIADAEKTVAHLNDSLKSVGAGMVFRLATKKEFYDTVANSPYKGKEDDLEPFFNPEYGLILALEYNKDRNGTVVVPDHVTVMETQTQRCACGEKRGPYTIERRFKSMLQCQTYIRRKMDGH